MFTGSTKKTTDSKTTDLNKLENSKTETKQETQMETTAPTFNAYKPTASTSNYSSASGKSTSSQDEATLISQGTELQGTISFAHKLEFNGRLVGEIHADGPLIIGDKAVIKGNITSSAAVIVYGRIKGNITTKDRIELKEAAQLYGDVKAAKFIVAEGALFVGKSDTPDGVKPDTDFSNIFSRMPSGKGTTAAVLV